MAGRITSKPFTLADGPYSYPAILWKPLGEVHVVWSGTKPDRYKFHRWSDDEGLTWSETWRDHNIGGYQGLPALALDSSLAVHWLTVASVFSIQNDSLYHQVWQDGKWSAGQIVLRGEPVEQNGQDVAAEVVLGDVLVVANQVPIASDIQPGGWQYEIYTLRMPLLTAHLQPVALVASTPVTPNLEAIAIPAALSATETSLLPPGSLTIAPSQSPLIVIGIGVLAAVAVISLLIFINLRQLRS